MDKYGFFRATAAFPTVKVADTAYNTAAIISLIDEAEAAGSELIVLPELCITGYTCGDLFSQRLLLESARDRLVEIARHTEGKRLMAIVGLPLVFEGKLYNCAAACASGKVVAIVPKQHLPNYNEFYEQRWFASGFDKSGTVDIAGEKVPFGMTVVRHRGVGIGIEICEDMWVPNPQSIALTAAGADVIANLSATDELIAKHDYLLSLISSRSATLRCGYVYSSAGPGESSTDAVYAGNAIIADDGRILATSPRFTEKAQMVTADIDIEILRHDRRHFGTYHDHTRYTFAQDVAAPTADAEPEETRLPLLRPIAKHPFVPADGPKLDERCREVTSIQTAGFVQRLRATGCKAITVGISGGLDSTLALLIAVKAFDKLGIDRRNIHAITMPGFGTTKRTHTNAHTIMERLGVTLQEIPIGPAVRQHFQDIGQDPEVHDTTYENCQARERTQILMDYANKVGAMVLGTGDLSELALGWCTYNADHMSMYNVNVSVPKTLVRHLVAWIASHEDDKALRDALHDIIDTPVSPELTPADANGNIAQKTEDLVGPYELHDFFLYQMMRYGMPPRKIYFLAREIFADDYDADVIKHWLRTFYRRFFTQQFKRSCLPDGPKTGSISISPRADWRMPSDASSALWLAEIDSL